jgi:hypothetical protein
MINLVGKYLTRRRAFLYFKETIFFWYSVWLCGPSSLHDRETSLPLPSALSKIINQLRNGHTAQAGIYPADHDCLIVESWRSLAIVWSLNVVYMLCILFSQVLPSAFKIYCHVTRRPKNTVACKKTEGELWIITLFIANISKINRFICSVQYYLT